MSAHCHSGASRGRARDPRLQAAVERSAAGAPLLLSIAAFPAPPIDSLLLVEGRRRTDGWGRWWTRLSEVGDERRRSMMRTGRQASGPRFAQQASEPRLPQGLMRCRCTSLSSIKLIRRAVPPACRAIASYRSQLSLLAIYAAPMGPRIRPSTSRGALFSTIWLR